MSKRTKPSWTFTVGDVSDIDIKKILDETPQNSPWCIIADRGGAARLIALRTEFCERFRTDDGVRVAGEDISPDWGYSRGYYAHVSGRGSFTCHHHSVPAPEHWRLRSTSGEESLAELMKRLAAAKNYRRRIPVRVYVDEGECAGLSHTPDGSGPEESADRDAIWQVEIKGSYKDIDLAR